MIASVGTHGLLSCWNYLVVARGGLLGGNPLVASAIGLAGFFLGTAIVTALIHAMPQHRRLMLSILVFSTCHIKKPWYQEILFQDYRGVDRGFGVTIPDLFFFGFFLFILMGGIKGKIHWFPPGTFLWLGVIVVSIFSLTGSAVPLYGLFTLHKFMRCLVLYWVFANLLREEEDVHAVLRGLTAAVLFQGLVVLWTKYVTRTCIFRSVGSFPHPNSLAMYLELLMPILLALILARVVSERHQRWAGLAILLGFVAVIFTKSRAALVIMNAALAAVTAVSFLGKPTARKAGIIASALVGVCFIGMLAAPRIIERFEKAPKESAETREHFNHAAAAMAQDETFGVGLNMFSWSLENTNYYWYVYSDKLELEDPDEFRESENGKSRLGTCHHILYLFAGETGWPGAIVFFLFLVRLYLWNLWLWIRTKNPLFKAILLGLLVGVATTHLTGLLEWVFRQTQVMYLFFLLNGTMVAIGHMDASALRRNRNRRKGEGHVATALPLPHHS